MRPLIIATTVLLLLLPLRVKAANNDPSPDFSDRPNLDKPLTEEQKEMRETTDVAPKPHADYHELYRLGYYHRARHELAVLIGDVYDNANVPDGGQPLLRGSLLYMFHDQKDNAFELGLHGSTDQRGAVSFAWRWNYSRSAFRPYSKAGVSVRINPEDQFATVLKYKYYRGFGALGFEQLLAKPMSFRFEVQAGASLSSFDASADAGLVWAW